MLKELVKRKDVYNQGDKDEFQNLEVNVHEPTRHRPRPGFKEMFSGFPDFNSFEI